ncbi:MAG: hypothetical protein IPJ98_18660 [Bryobacterales bacterium]|nr:hypothetical protein [Bryobacterales bacterium]
MPFERPQSPTLPLPLIFHPKPGKTLLWLGISLLFATLGGWMSLRGDSRGPFLGLLFTFLFVVFLVRLVPNASFLKLDRDGFTLRTFFRDHFVPWSDIDRFFVVNQKSYGITTNRYIGYNYSEHTRKLKAVRAFNRLFTDAEALIEPVGMKAAEQAAILNECLLRFRQGQTAPR